jgi:hypothetical protein
MAAFAKSWRREQAMAKPTTKFVLVAETFSPSGYFCATGGFVM